MTVALFDRKTPLSGVSVLCFAISSCTPRSGVAVSAPVPTEETAHEPAPPESWDPDEPSFDEDAGLAWLPVTVAPPCNSAPVPALITTEAAFSRSFCSSSTIDWKSYRLVIYVGADLGAPRALRVTGVRREAGRVIVSISASGACHEYNGWHGGFAATLISASDEPVFFIRGESFMPECVTPSDGYGY